MAKSATGQRRRIRDVSKLRSEPNEEEGQPKETTEPKEDPQRFLSEDFLLVLDEHRKNCEREGKLDEA
jgi:hypothetical protein